MNAALLIGVLASAIMSGTSLLYATLGEIVGERAGIVNLGLEGIMLISASTGFAATVLRSRHRQHRSRPHQGGRDLGRR